MRLAKRVGALATLATLLAAAPARGEGIFAEAGLGAQAFIGDGANYAALGPAFDIRAGYAPQEWLAIGLYAAGSMHATTTPPPPEHQFFQMYKLGADVRWTLPVGRIGLFAEGSGGIAFINTNVLDQVGITLPYRHSGPFLLAGGGIEYHSDNPRFAFGIAGDYGAYPLFPGLFSVGMRVTVRYAW
ncbi:MAG TPA: hypothetical protein VKE22_12365 [Haliangiales bacterium]|nr:hypothetical protein [Haliangiales bacterium]